MSVLECGSQILLVSKHIFFQYALKLHRQSFQDVMFINNITLEQPFFFLLHPVANGLTQHFQSTVGIFPLHSWLLH
jgi:hypothetical protein